MIWRLVFVLCFMLVACSRSTIQIGPGSGPFEIQDNHVFINSSLLGLEGRTVNIDTTRNNDVDVSIVDSPARKTSTGGAF